MNWIDWYRKNRFIRIPLITTMLLARNREYYKFMEKSEKWSKDKMMEWTFNQVRNIVDFAYEYVPYYHDLYRNIGYEKGSLTKWEDFYKLPTIKKDDIKHNLSYFTPTNLDKIDFREQYTGGSISKPMKFNVDKRILDRESAFFQYYWKKHGYRLGDRCVVLRGQRVADPTKRLLYGFDRIYNYLLLDSCCISKPEYFEVYDKSIRDFRANFIQAYPSSLYIFAKMYETKGVIAPRFERIFLGSENISQDQNEYIRDIFGAKEVVYHYGHSECASVATKYQDYEGLGFFYQYGYTEFLDIEDGAVDIFDGDAREIVTTGYSRSMPFIRYRTGDLAVIDNYQSEDYMRNCISAKRIIGRKQECVVTKSRRKISMCTVDGAHISALSKIGDVQYEQNEIGVLNIYVTSMDNELLKKDVVLDIKSGFEKVFGTDLDVNIKQVQQIQRTHRGKKILLKQNLNLDYI